MTTYYVRNGSSDLPVSIADGDYLASGGEKKVYTKSNTAYCIYHEPTNAVPVGKMSELSVNHDGFIAPSRILLDANKKRVGETMPLVGDSYVLCQLFSKAFRRKHGVDHSTDLSIIAKMIEVMRAAHAAGVILVDANDMNWLVSKDFKRVFLVDTPSCQTKSFRATAIKPAIFDPFCNKSFSERSDYYSLAIVVTWLWCGIHPFCCGIKGVKADMAEKMNRFLSVWSKKAELNSACRSPHSMPPELAKWSKACLTSKDRPAPPSVVSGVFIPSQSIPATVAPVGITLVPSGSHIDDGSVRCYDESTGETLVYSNGQLSLLKQAGSVSFDSRHVFSSGGNLYAVIANSLSRVDSRIVNGGIRFSTAKVANLAEMPTILGTGCVIQDLLGRKVIATARGTSVLKGLEQHRILSAVHHSSVVVVSAVKSGHAQVWTYADMTGQPTVRDVVTPTEPNFCVTDSGIVVENRDGELVAWHRRKPGNEKAATIDPDCKLYANGSAVMGSIGNKLYRVTLT